MLQLQDNFYLIIRFDYLDYNLILIIQELKPLRLEIRL